MEAPEPRRAGVAIAPILPGLSGRPDRLEAVVVAARAAGATHLWAGMLHLRDGTRQHFMTTLERHWPELIPQCERAYRERQYLPPALSEAPIKDVARLRALHEVADRRRLRIEPPPPPKQLSLLG